MISSNILIIPNNYLLFMQTIIICLPHCRFKGHYHSCNSHPTVGTTGVNGQIKKMINCCKFFTHPVNEIYPIIYCFVVLCLLQLYHESLLIHVIHWPIVFRVVSLVDPYNQNSLKSELIYQNFHFSVKSMSYQIMVSHDKGKTVSPLSFFKIEIFTPSKMVFILKQMLKQDPGYFGERKALEIFWDHSTFLLELNFPVVVQFMIAVITFPVGAPDVMVINFLSHSSPLVPDHVDGALRYLIILQITYLFQRQEYHPSNQFFFHILRVWWLKIEGLMQERCNSIANALELHLFCTNPSIFNHQTLKIWKNNWFEGWYSCLWNKNMIYTYNTGEKD